MNKRNKVPNRYELAYRKVWNELPNWKRRALQEDRIADKDSGLWQSFLQQVITMAEDLTVKLYSDTLTQIENEYDNVLTRSNS